MEPIEGNLLIVQCDSESPVANASLQGVVMEALNHECIEEVYGSSDGVTGLLRDQLLDLAQQPQQIIKHLSSTSGHVLGHGGTGHSWGPEELKRALEVIKAHNLRYLFFIGGHEALKMVRQIHEAAKLDGFTLQALHIPHLYDNSLAIGDHCLGYGSVIKALSARAKNLFPSAEENTRSETVTLLSLPAGANSWMAAGSILLKHKTSQVPHLICIPEIPFQAEAFIDQLEAKREAYGSCLVVTTDQLRDADGRQLTGPASSGHAKEASSLPSSAAYLTKLIEGRLGASVKTTQLEMGELLRPLMLSETDRNEAVLCGQKAVQLALKGASGKSLGLLRKDSTHFASETSLVMADPEDNLVRRIPDAWVRKEEFTLGQPYFQYAFPLIQGEVFCPFEAGMPHQVVLERKTIKRVIKMNEPGATVTASPNRAGVETRRHRS